MAAPSTPTNLYLQQANSQVYLSWDLTSGATSYAVNRSTDGVTFAPVGTPSTPFYLDTAITTGTLYYYNVQAVNGTGSSAATATQTIISAPTGQMSLGMVRLLAQQEADRVKSNFVSLPEWNSYIRQSYFELYDLLTTLYEDYFVAPVYTFTTSGVNLYSLPNGTITDAVTGLAAAPFYKLLGVDLGLAGNSNAWVTIKKFDFISRNRYVFPQLTTTYLGVFNLRYRLLGNQIEFIPTPSAGQFLRMWYIPRLSEPLKDTDLLDGVSGWTEYVVVDAAIKALEKEESDTSALMVRKSGLIKRIEESAMNRDAGMPDTISDVRSWSESGGYGPPNGDGGYGGY